MYYIWILSVVSCVADFCCFFTHTFQSLCTVTHKKESKSVSVKLVLFIVMIIYYLFTGDLAIYVEQPSNEFFHSCLEHFGSLSLIYFYLKINKNVVFFVAKRMKMERKSEKLTSSLWNDYVF